MCARRATRRSSDSPRDEGPKGLYVHIPFCEVKCSYCHFAIDPGRPDADRHERYVRALVREIEESRVGGAADTLYFGGGTPSLLSSERLGRITRALASRFELLPAGRVEVTLEANPRDLDEEGYEGRRYLGVNRLSLGVQTMDDGVLAAMGRPHRAQDARAAVGHARAAGFENVSLDLILGWPGEGHERWSRVLEETLSMAPDHLSLYVLEVEEKTLLRHQLRRGSWTLPDDDLVADLYSQTVETLSGAGLVRYEISNFARSGFTSRHNGKYWNDEPFVGFGMSAHSYILGTRSWNAPTYQGYCSAIEARGSAASGERSLTPKERREEALFTGLRRLEGIDIEAFGLRYGSSPLEEFARELERPLAAGLVTVRDGRLALTDKGYLVSNEVFRSFV